MACTGTQKPAEPPAEDTPAPDTDATPDSGGDGDSRDSDDSLLFEVSHAMSKTIGAVAVVRFTASGEGPGVLRFELDRDNGTATTVREYEDELTSFVMGDVTEHPNGNIRIAWSTTGRIDEVNPDGQRVSRLTFSEVRTVGYLSVYDAIGPTP